MDISGRTPRWHVWSRVPEVTLLEAVALSMDIEPQKIRKHKFDRAEFYRSGTVDESAAFMDRLETLMRNVDSLLPSGHRASAETKVPTATFVKVALKFNWSIPQPLRDLLLAPTEINGEIAIPSPSMEWPAHTTPKLEALKAVLQKFWKNYDPSDPGTAPTNEMVSKYIQETYKFSSAAADSIASILRPGDLKTGPRRK